MAIFDLLGRSWTIGILWHLSEGGDATFGELQQRCEAISPTVLTTRLNELQQGGLIERTGHGYTATPLGRELFGMLSPLGNWSRKWAAKINPDA